MARAHSPNSADPPKGDRIHFADLLSGWLLLGVGLVMIAFLWLMPAQLEVQQLARERDALHRHLAQMSIANEDQQNLLTALENHDPVLIERLACHYLGLRPVGSQGRPTVVPSDRQLALYSDEAPPESRRIADLPRRATWQDVVNETTSLRLTAMPALPKAPDLPDTQLVSLTTGDKRFFVLALAGLCLFAGIRSAPRAGEGPGYEQPKKKRKPAPRVARSEWTQAYEAGPVEALAVAGVGTAMSARFGAAESNAAVLEEAVGDDGDDWADFEDQAADEAGDVIETDDELEADDAQLDASDDWADEIGVTEGWGDDDAAADDDEPAVEDTATIDATAGELIADWDAVADEEEMESEGSVEAGEMDATIDVEADELDADWDEDALDLIADGDGFDAVSTSEAFDEDDDGLFAPPSA